MINVGIIEDNKYMREGWQTFIDYEKDLCVIGCFDSCEAAFHAPVFERMNVLIQDIGLPGMSGIECVRKIRTEYPDIHIIIASVFEDDDNVFEAIKAGAIGYLTKKITPDEMIDAIRDAQEGGSPITPSIARKIVAEMHAPIVDQEHKLSDRELQILQELATGKSYAAIGKSIYLSVDGVRHHVRSIYRKLEVHNRTEAVKKGIDRKIL